MADENIKEAVDPVLNTVGTTLVSTLEGPSLIAELGFGLLILVLLITVHGWCMGVVSKFFAIRFARFGPEAGQWRVSLLVGITIALLASVHLMETLIWAFPIWWFGLISGFRRYLLLRSGILHHIGRCECPTTVCLASHRPDDCDFRAVHIQLDRFGHGVRHVRDRTAPFNCGKICGEP